MKNYLLDSSTYYYYCLLNENEKKAYSLLLNGMVAFAEKIGIPEELNISVEQLETIYGAVNRDRGDIFWCAYLGYRYYKTPDGVVCSVSPEYTYTREQARDKISEIKNSKFYRDINTLIIQQSTPVEKALAAYEYIVKNTDYVSGAPNQWDITGVILDHKAVCAAYAKAFFYFMNKHGIRCAFVHGRKEGEGGHAWNLLYLDGESYYVDSTWADPVRSGEENPDPDYISYSYFCITTEELEKTHNQYTVKEVMPLCTATRYNYYVYMGLIDDEYTIESVIDKLCNIVSKGENVLNIKYTNHRAYTIARECLFENNKIYDAIDAVNVRSDSLRLKKSYRYNYCDELFTLRVSLQFE